MPTGIGEHFLQDGEMAHKTKGHGYLCPRFENSQFFHGCGTLPVQLTWGPFSSLNFVQRRHKQVVYSTQIIEITDNSTPNPGTAYLVQEKFLNFVLKKMNI